MLVPEIREWMELDFAPELAAGGDQGLRGMAREFIETGVEGTVLVGFSFGAPQALFAAADEQLAGRIHGVVGWGGYADIERTFRFSFTGCTNGRGHCIGKRRIHMLGGSLEGTASPCPDRLPGHVAVARALQRLACEAVRGVSRSVARREINFVCNSEASFHPPIAHYSTFSRQSPAENRTRALRRRSSNELVPAIRRSLPLVEPIPLIHRLPVATRLLHSRSDQLIPFTETLRLGTVLEPWAPDLSTRLTGLFGHSGKQEPRGRWIRAKENLSFLQSLRGVFDLIGAEP